MTWSSNPVDGKYVSFSSVELYNLCPFKYYQQYVEKKWGPANIFVVMGITLHNILEGAYISGNFSPEHWSKKLTVMFREVTEDQFPELLHDKMEYARCKNRTDYLIFHTFALVKKNKLDVQIDSKFVETKLKGKAFGWKVGGKSDLIVPDPHPDYIGYNILLDLKSSQKESITHHYQGLLYREMAPKSFNIKRVGILYPAFDELIISDEKYRMEAAKFLRDAIGGLDQRKFEPKRNQYCQYCHLKEPCPIYKCRPRKKKS